MEQLLTCLENALIEVSYRASRRHPSADPQSLMRVHMLPPGYRSFKEVKGIDGRLRSCVIRRGFEQSLVQA